MKKSGFTLIELLAVILILGIIALIAIPTISTIIEDTKKGTLKSSVANIAKVTEEQCQIERMKGTDITNNYTIIDGKLSSPLSIKNTPNSGNITVTDECDVSVAIIDNGYCAIKNGDKIAVNGNLYDCNPEYVPISETEESCFIFDENTHTITGYDFDNSACPTDISIPVTINGILVEHIGDFAFIREYNDILWKVNREEIGSFVSDTPDSYQALGFTEPKEVIPIIRIEGTKKKCLNVNTLELEDKPFDFIINEDYQFCSILNTSFNTSDNTITRVDFANAKNLKTIGTAAFMNNRIEEIYFGNLPNLISIGVSAFDTNLLSDSVNLTGLISISEISDSLFANNELTNIIFPPNIVKIGVNSFYNNNVESLEIPNLVNEIGALAFWYNNVNSINTNNVQTIGSSSFANNPLLASLTTKAETIGKFAFQKTAITSYNLGNNLKTIDHGAFSYNKVVVNQLRIPASVETIEGYAFYVEANNRGIKNLIFESEQIDENTYKGVKRIEIAAFYHNIMTSLTLPASLEYIGEWAFLDNSKLKSLTLVEGIKYIDKEAFLHCPIESLALPASLETIGQSAFSSGKKLKTVVFKEGLKNISKGAFYNNILEEINLPNSIVNLEASAFSNNNIAGDAAFIHSIKNGVVDLNTISNFAGPSESDIVIPSHFTTIDAYAFYNCRANSILIPSTIKTIKTNAFIYLNNSNAIITIENGVETIESDAFQCTSSSYCNYRIELRKLITDTVSSTAPWGNIYAAIDWQGPNPVTSVE